MLTKMLQHRNRVSNPSTETGISVAETMIAFVIIAIVLVATALTMTTSFRSSATLENRARAAGYAAEVLAIAKQADFKQLYVITATPTPSSTFGNGKCDTDQTSMPSGMTRVTTGTGGMYPGLGYCKMRQAGNQNNAIGAEFFVQTKIGYVTSGQGQASVNYFPKRVIVTVTWRDVASGENAWHTYKTSYTRTPSGSDCIPDTIAETGTRPAGCRP